MVRKNMVEHYHGPFDLVQEDLESVELNLTVETTDNLGQPEIQGTNVVNELTVIPEAPLEEESVEEIKIRDESQLQTSLIV